MCTADVFHSCQVLRCFPHCCPEHRDRSYCGVPLRMTIRIPDATASEFSACEERSDNNASISVAQLDDIVVYGRFERDEPDSNARGSELASQLALGQRVSPALITDSQQQDPWMQAQAETLRDPQSTDEVRYRQSTLRFLLCWILL